MLVKELLHLSPLRLVTARPDNSIREAARRMAQYRVGLIVVMDDDDRFVGVLSERDIVTGLGDPDRSIEDIVVGDMMTESVVTISPDASLVDAALVMNTHGIRHLVAVEGDSPVGVLSIRDVLRIFARQVLNSDGETDGQIKMDFARALAAA